MTITPTKPAAGFDLKAPCPNRQKGRQNHQLAQWAAQYIESIQTSKYSPLPFHL